MDLQERINVLTQGAKIAQKNGALTLDDAYYAKQAIDILKSNAFNKEAFEILIKIASTGQKNGVYTLRDAHLIYLATENYESAFVRPQPVPQPVPQPEPQPAQPVTRKTTKKES